MLYDSASGLYRVLRSPSVTSGAGVVGPQSIYFTGDLGGGTVAGGYAAALPTWPEAAFPGDFTWEGYILFDAAAGSTMRSFFASIGAGWGLVRDTARKIRFGLYGVSTYIAGSTTVADGVLTKWSLTRSGTTVTLRVNGNIEGTSTRAESVPANTVFIGGGSFGAGGVGGSASPFFGVMDSIRMTTAARYATGATYTPDFNDFSVGASDPFWDNTILLLLGNAGSYSGVVGLPPPPPVYRYYWGGLGRIVGTTKIKGTPNTPVKRRVRLIREVDGVCVGERWSDPVTGAYSFEGFDPTILYTVIVYDGPRVFRAAVQDAVVPEIYTP